MESATQGQLIVIPTPIGNLGDMTQRSKEMLQECDALLAEDTRVTRKLLTMMDLQATVFPFHQHNEHHATPAWINQLKQGKKLGLVSDAGTPGISDPAFLLVRAAIEANISVTCLPGPTAFVPALVMSGIPCDRFYFGGFLPPKKGRQTKWEFMASLPCTLVLYESPHRIKKTLKEALEHCGANRPAAIVREISKFFEETIRGTLSELVELSNNSTWKGEIVLVIGLEP